VSFGQQEVPRPRTCCCLLDRFGHESMESSIFELETILEELLIKLDREVKIKEGAENLLEIIQKTLKNDKNSTDQVTKVETQLEISQKKINELRREIENTERLLGVKQGTSIPSSESWTN
jgi:hypothetical protein